MKSYADSAKKFETKWQQYWAEQDILRTPNPNDPDFDPSKPKYVIMDMFPYPSGIGLHIGHPLGYIATDVKQRNMRMRGFNVMYSMGFDSFGLPAEQYAIQTGQHPRITTENNIANMLRQLNYLGLGHDPHRRFNTTDPDYYRWTQWIFQQIYHSYYDPTETWKGPDGFETTGRARPIKELPDRLRSGEWVLDSEGEPCPKSLCPNGKVAQEAEIPAALEKARLAFIADIPVNWCPMLGTVLSNEEVTNEGLSERGNYPVFKRPLKQWNLRITQYADRLLKDLEDVDWPNGVVEMQRGWIGRSEGAMVDFTIQTQQGANEVMTIYTTRPDTLFGATYMVMAPAHPFVNRITTPAQQAEVDAYRREAQKIKGAAETSTRKTGVFTGGYAINPVNQERIPIWIADYVLMEYGTGAIMAVPAHDERDFEFAKVFNLPIRAVVLPNEEWLQTNAPEALKDAAIAEIIKQYQADPASFPVAFTGMGKNIQSQNEGVSLNGLDTPEAKRAIAQWLEGQGLGYLKVQFKLRDWLFSRQRYWGEPFPVVFDEATDRHYAVDANQLPVLLPELDDFAPVGSDDPNSLPEPPLARAKEWMTVKGIILNSEEVHLLESDFQGEEVEYQGRTYPVHTFKRDANSMPNWAGSCWYYLRYYDPKNDSHMVDPKIEAYWSTGQKPDGSSNAGSVDLYVGGTEHAVLHLLYARFWHKVLYDLGHVTTKEPFQRLFNQGMITADAYKDNRGVYVDIHDVQVKEENGKSVAYQKSTGEQLIIDPGKMGKRYKNGIPPEEVCDEYTIDTFRMFEMYLGPLDADKPWNSDSIIGILRVLSSIWSLMESAVDDEQAGAIPPEMERLYHQTIRKVSEDIDRLRFNTAIAAMIEFKNALNKMEKVPKSYVRTLVLLISPYAPHMAEELISRHYPEEHSRLKSVIHFPWPEYDPEKCQEDEVEVPVMINGKKRTVLQVPVDISEEDLKAMAMQDDKVKIHTAGKTIQRIVPVMKPRPKLLNIVVK